MVRRSILSRVASGAALLTAGACSSSSVGSGGTSSTGGASSSSAATSGASGGTIEGVPADARNGDASAFLTALRASGVADQLRSKQVTVFAPGDGAFTVTRADDRDRPVVVHVLAAS